MLDAFIQVPWLEWWWLFPTVFIAGFVDSVAGGGGLISMPAYVLAGVPPQILLGTNKFVSCLGTVASASRYMYSRRMHWPSVWLGLPFTLLGAALGAHTVARLDPLLIKRIILIMLPIAAMLVLVPRRNHTDIATAPETTSWHWRCAITSLAFVLGWYDGFFGPGTGTMLALGLHGVARLPFLQAIAASRALNLFTNAGALLMFLWHGQVWFALGVPLVLASIAGHSVGSHVALRRGTDFIRGMLALACTLLVVYLVVR